jgi:hypothetical protein
MKWSFRCWSCGHFDLGQYFQLPKTICPKCGAGRTFTSLKRTSPERRRRMPTTETQIEATNLWLLTNIDPRRGVQVTCDQRLDDIGGPRVTITRGDHGWRIAVRPRKDEPWTVTLEVPAYDTPLLRFSGVRTGTLLFDDDVEDGCNWSGDWEADDAPSAIDGGKD